MFAFYSPVSLLKQSYFIFHIAEFGNFSLATLFDGEYIKLHWPETARMGMFVYPM